ncbi:MAG: ABC-2 type transport system ATP-binding protein [Planctomycetota bacterium]|jgi:ABC-2 type transport system ATP-binding protein
MTESIITLEKLEKRYGKVRALAGASVDVPLGPVGLLGPNGAGKTTLIKLLLGLLQPNSGSANIAGCNPLKRSGRFALRKLVGYMPEGDCLLPEMSGVELVSTLGRITGLSRQDAMTRAHEVLDYVELEEARYRGLEQYSTGMKQRLKLAQALVHDPKILLLDEPTNGLDPKGRRHMLDVISNLGRVQKKNVLLCSHLLNDVEETCDHVIVMNRGTFVLQGSIAELTEADGLRLEIGVDGDLTPLINCLREEGFTCDTSGPKQLTVVLGGSGGTTRDLDWETAGADEILRIGAKTATRITSIDMARSTLEDAFLSAVSGPTGSEASAALEASA